MAESELRPSVTEPASPVPTPSAWAAAAGVATPGVYVPGSPPWSDQRLPSASPAVSPAWPQPAPPAGPWRGRGVIALVVVVAVVVFSVVGVVIGTRSNGHAKSGSTSSAGLSAGSGPSAGAGVSAGSGPSAGASKATVPSGSTSSGSAAGLVPLGDGQALIGKVVPAPAGAHIYDVDDSSAGVMDVQQYVRHYFKGDASELSRLRQEGFQVAASTDYVRSDGIEIATHLVQFTDATGAQDYFDVEKSAWTADDRVTATFEVPATPDAVGYELSKVDSLGNRRSVMYERVGNVVAVVNVYTSRQIDQAVDVKALRAQLAALG